MEGIYYSYEDFARMVRMYVHKTRISSCSSVAHYNGASTGPPENVPENVQARENMSS
jgi:hypothetical protein